MRERFGPPGPIRDSVHRLLDQLTKDTQRDLTMIGFLPDVEDSSGSATHAPYAATTSKPSALA